MQKSRSTFFSALSLLAFFIIIYSFFYSGTYVTDDEHILSARSLSFAFDKTYNISRVLGNTRVFEFSLAPGRWAIEAANVEPAQAVFGAFLAKLSVLLKVGRIQTLFLLNIVTTALTSVVVYLSARKQKYSHLIGFILSLLFGLCTIAFPYSHTFFRDSLAMFFISCSWYFSISIRNSVKKYSSIISWMGLLVSIIIGILSKNTVIIAIPVILTQLIVWNKSNSKFRPSFENKRHLFKWLLIIPIALGLLAIWVFIIPEIPIFARFSFIYYRSIITNFISNPHPNIIQALIGPFFSPGKSIFLFSPILILSIICLFYRFKTSWPSWFYLILLIIFQALFYDVDWAGHVNWGLRYILPAIPPLLLSIAPLIEKMIRSVFGKVMLVSLAIISLFIQILGTITPISAYFSEKASAAIPVTEHSMIWDFNQSPILWCLNWIFTGQIPNLAIARVKEGLVFMLICVFLTTILSFLSIKFYRFRKLSIIALFIAIISSIFMLIIYKNDPAYYPTRIDLKNSQAQIVSKYQSDDLILLKSYGTSAWDYWMNWTSPKVLWIALPFSYPSPVKIEQFNQTHNPNSAMEPNTSAILNQNVKSSHRVWLVLPNDSPGADLGIEQTWLEERSISSACEIFSGNSEDTKLCLYEIK
jgi:hypothetical protein